MNQDKYDPSKIEQKWQKEWEAKEMYHAEDSSSVKKFYPLVEFPFPSGAGLHTGHVRSYTAMDIVARKHRMQGENVLYPIGWDAFGLPTENYAIKTGIHPQIVTQQNTDNFRRQLKALGLSFDWKREVNTSDPEYYKWTQWIFIQMFKKGLAYKDKISINWCPKDKIGLANEEVVNGCCERCGTPVEKRDKEQWMLAITKYADRLDKDLDTVDYLERIKIQQRNWIGKSEGAEIDFKVGEEKITVFTTRPDTLFGVTYIVLSPEHPLVKNSTDPEVISYAKAAKIKTEIERTDATKEKTGVELKGVKAINPATEEQVPVYVADYVLAEYGTGAVMAVPAHDERDFAFAKKYKNKFVRVIQPNVVKAAAIIKPEKEFTNTTEMIDQAQKNLEEFKEIYTGEDGVLINSKSFTGLSSLDAKKKITDSVKGRWVTKYKLRDWVFSRQRYWGEPIPMIHCESCGWIPVEEQNLPVVLPDVEKYEPSDDGESPLASITDWVKTTCPQCGKEAKRETDTMPNWAGSSWYYLRYVDPENTEVFADRKLIDKWTPVDWYNGGMEHTTLHLLYSRFWHKFLFDIGVVPTAEPYAKRTSHGLILAAGGEKMSKSKGNVVSPDELVTTFGADALRLYEMFMGPFDQAIAWDSNGLVGTRRFIEKVWRLKEKLNTESSKELSPMIHKTIKKISEDIEEMKFNTAVSQLMITVNSMETQEKISTADYQAFLKLLAPFAPHASEELWNILGNTSSIHLESWPTYDESRLQDETITIAVQVNGKTRETITIPTDTTEDIIKETALATPGIKKWTDGKTILRTIYVKNRILNLIIDSQE